MTALAGTAEMDARLLPGISSLFRIPGLLIQYSNLLEKVCEIGLSNADKMGKIMEIADQVNVDEMESANLLDCYRIALDFGMPAALKAYEKLRLEATHKSATTSTSLKKEELLTS